MKVVLTDVRCSYVFLEEPREGKYSMQILIDKGSKNAKAIEKAVAKVAREKFGDKTKLTMLKLPLRDGDAEREGEEYEGKLFINGNNSRKPGIVNRRNEPADAADIEEFCFSGAYFHVSINFYGFNHEGKKGIAASIQNVMLRKKGPRLDGSESAQHTFSGFAEDGFDDDFDDDIPF